MITQVMKGASESCKWDTAMTQLLNLNFLGASSGLPRRLSNADEVPAKIAVKIEIKSYNTSTECPVVELVLIEGGK